MCAKIAKKISSWFKKCWTKPTMTRCAKVKPIDALLSVCTFAGTTVWYEKKLYYLPSQVQLSYLPYYRIFSSLQQGAQRTRKDLVIWQLAHWLPKWSEYNFSPSAYIHYSTVVVLCAHAKTRIRLESRSNLLRDLCVYLPIHWWLFYGNLHSLFFLLQTAKENKKKFIRRKYNFINKQIF